MPLFYVSKGTISSIIWASTSSLLLTLDILLGPCGPVNLCPQRWRFFTVDSHISRDLLLSNCSSDSPFTQIRKISSSLSSFKEVRKFVFCPFIAENPPSHAALLGEAVVINWIRTRIIWISSSFSSRRSNELSTNMRNAASQKGPFLRHSLGFFRSKKIMC